MARCRRLDALELSVPVARHMVGLLKGGRPDFAVWGAVVPSLMWSNIAREVLMDAGIDPTTPAFSTVMACSTSMMGAIEAAGMIDGDSLQSRAGRRRRQPEPRPDRARPAAVGLAAQVPAGALARPEARSRHARASERHPPVHPGDRQPHLGPQHGRAHRDHREGMADRPAGAGRDRAAEPSQFGGRLGQGLLRRPRDRRSAR